MRKYWGLILLAVIIITMFIVVFTLDPMGKTGSIIPEGY